LDYFIGTSGYYYPQWRENFYKGKPAQWLSEYSRVFNSVELNGTFYRLPKVHALKKQADQTPDNFRFSVKASRYITHILRLKEAKQTIKDFEELIEEGLGKKLGRILLQMPPSFLYKEETLEALLENVPDKTRMVIEFRHASWWNEEVYKIFRKKKYTFCNVSFPGLDVPVVDTGKHFYFRFHGVPELFKSSYSDKELKSYVKRFPKTTRENYIYFNNTFYQAGYENAQTIMKLLGF
jgi:uncharacterized protein YecE (DUF72 family)